MVQGANAEERTRHLRRRSEEIATLLPLEAIRTEILRVLPSGVLPSDLEVVEDGEGGVHVAITLRDSGTKDEVNEAIESGLFVSRLASSACITARRVYPDHSPLYLCRRSDCLTPIPSPPMFTCVLQHWA